MRAALSASAALAILNARMAEALVEQERIARELELAAEIQRSLLPEPGGHDFPVAGINYAARTVSGDFYDFFPLDDGRICFNLGDVSGKGMNAALLMAKTSSLYHCLGKTVHDPGRRLAEAVGGLPLEVVELVDGVCRSHPLVDHEPLVRLVDVVGERKKVPHRFAI